jgi:hypothetical protein
MFRSRPARRLGAIIGYFCAAALQALTPRKPEDTQ